MERFDLLHEGSAKDILYIDEESIGFRFTDFFSVFDVGRSGYEIPLKGKALCACAVRSFEIAKTIGIPTHFVEQIDDVTIRVKKTRIVTDDSLTASDRNYLVPAEWIYRLRVAGSIHRDFSSEKKKPEDYGLPAGVVPDVGTPFPYPVHMLTTKFEKRDREITEDDVCTMSGIISKDRDDFWSMIDRLTGAIALELSKVGFVLLDGKMECLIGPKREKMIADVFGTPDEDRFCGLFELRRGVVKHFSKEYIRQVFMESGYYKELTAARDQGLPDPPIPKLSEEEIEEVTFRYISVAEAYSGKKLN